MERIARPAQLFIALIALGGLAMATYAALGLNQWHRYQFLTLLVISVVASRLKLKLPGLNGNLSVNLPFILTAVVQLSLAEALLIGCASTFAQCLPKRGGRSKPVQVFFNVCTMAIAAGLASFIFTRGFRLKSLLSSAPATLAVAALVFFLANTLPVATIISLSEGPKVLKVWSSIFQLSFPYYVASAGITSMVTAASRHVGWQVPLLVLAVMYGIYRSYQLYFGRMLNVARALNLVAVDKHSLQSEMRSMETV